MEKCQQREQEDTCSKRILIVEDDPLLGDLLLEALQEEAYEALHVLSGETARSILQTDAPALVLLDYHLPGMNGLELTDWLRSREERRHIPVILMSASVPPEINSRNHLKLLKKPFELETLLLLVAERLVSGARDGPGTEKAFPHNHDAQYDHRRAPTPLP